MDRVIVPILMRTKLYLVLLCFVLAGLPWLFPAGSSSRVLGFPCWAIYSLAVSAVYACVVSFVVWRFWEIGEDGSERGD
tara:strand:- start:922 stop:1158 length:237 start_codon:yes stop_codon:yes gene_type:complete